MKRESEMEFNHRQELLLTVVETGPVTVVSIQTSILTDVEASAAVAREIRAVVRRSESPNILLDFHRVEHLSMGFLGELRLIAEEIEARGGTFRCCSLSKKVQAVLEVLGLGPSYAGWTVQRAAMRHMHYLEKRAEAQTSAIASRY